MGVPVIKVVLDAAAVATEAANRVVEAAYEAISQRGSFTIALSGGSTPKALFELLAQSPYLARIDWSKVEIYFGDERTVPQYHPDSNYRMANDALLSKAPIPRENVHRMRGEIDPEAAAIEYGKMLKKRFGDDGLDMILLGMGPDGHTASLFPGTKALDETTTAASPILSKS